MERVKQLQALAAERAEAKKQKIEETPIEVSKPKESNSNHGKGKMIISDSVTTNGSGSSQVSSIVSLPTIPKPIFLFTPISKPSSATVLEMKYDRLKDLARVELKLYPTADDIKTKVVDLKVEILQICGHAKKIEYDESTGIMTVVEFEEQSFVQPAQSSQ